MRIQSDNFDEFIMVAPGSDYGIAMWSDIKNIENATFLDYVIDSSNKLMKVLHHGHFSFIINSIIQLPLQGLWKKHYALERRVFSSNKRICIIFTDISACRTDSHYLQHLHSLENVTMVLVLVNVMNSKKKLIMKRLSFFDQVYSFDKADCEKYGLDYYPTIYSVTRAPDLKAPIKTDAFFVGVSKGNRHELLTGVYQRIMNNGGRADFYISGLKDRVKRQKGIHYDQWLEYKDVLDHVIETNCVIEIMGAGQVGLTLRAMEAIVYNKKLLTNNKSIKSLRFFESGFVKYFEKLEDIDVDFICKKEAINYQYNGEFSPIHLLERINEAYKGGAK